MQQRTNYSVRIAPSKIVLVTRWFADSQPISLLGHNFSDFLLGHTFCTIDLRRNFPPYGKDFPNGDATGRFSNGRIATDINSEAFGLQPIVSAYLDPTYDISDFATGVCFASANVVEMFMDLIKWKEKME